MYFCGLVFAIMEAQNSSDEKSKAPKRGTLFLIAILLGLLFGTVITLLVMNLVGRPQHTVVHVLPSDSTATSAASDTVVKYVIHKYENAELQDALDQASDSLASDSVYAYDESEDLTMDDIDPYMAENSSSNGSVIEEKMISKQSAKVTYYDNNKTECAVPEHAHSSIQVQIWQTPIKNKVTYQFNGSTLKVKGMNLEHYKICHFKNNFYLVSNHHVYPLHTNSQFERLIETHEVVF